ncbi:terminase [Actinobacillus porcinus]|uniref:terminase n=1 Tax=Actinobacillus porcinus TaxID=51048 RepID=UPI002A908F73|nr:terminase [Actinobacillus porcinus]MDY6216342.1 terminase [Actinobacillus porcinus]
MLKRKLTVLLPTFRGASDELKHLFFILTDPCEDRETKRADMLLLVNCSTVYDEKIFDDTCILEVGEHAFIKHKSYIYYKETRIENLLDLEKGIEQKRFIKKEIINDELYQRILTGAFKSKQIERRYLRFLKNAMAQNACLDIFN